MSSLLHSFRKTADPLFLIKPELPHQFGKTLDLKLRIMKPVKSRHICRCKICRKIAVIRYVKKQLFRSFIVIDFHIVNGDAAFIWLQGFLLPFEAGYFFLRHCFQPVRTLPSLQYPWNVIDRLKCSKCLAALSDLYHFCSSLYPLCTNVSSSFSSNPLRQPRFTSSRNSLRKSSLYFSCIFCVSATKFPLPFIG